MSLVPEPEKPGDRRPPATAAAVRMLRERLRAEVKERAEEAESRAWEKLEAEVLDVLDGSDGRAIDLARAAAFEEAQTLAGHPWVSLPVRGQRAGEVAYLIGASSDDAHGGLVTEPFAEAYVNLDTLAVVVDRKAVDVETAVPMYQLPTAAARALPQGEGTALWSELNHLAERLAERTGDANDELDRFDALVRFLVPAELFPHYVALNPPFFERLAEVSGRGALAQTMEAPPFDPAYLPADPALFDLLSGESRWDFDCGTLSGAARDAGIGILEGSVLPISWDGASEAFEAVAGVSPSQWVAELAALAEPGWQVHVRGASLLGRHSVTYSIAKREPHAWVRTEDGASGCRVTVGVGPESAYRLALRSILELGVDGQADQFIEIGAADVARLLGSAAGQAGVVSDALAALRLPEPSSPPADSLDPLGLYAPQAFARALHGARAAVTVVSTAFSDGRRVSTGMAAIGTASGSWIIAPALPWSDAIPADAPVFLYSTTNKLLRASVAKAVGLPGPPVLEGPL